MNPNRMPLQRAMIAGIALAFLVLPAPSFVPASVAVHIGEPALAMYGGCDSGGGETAPDEDYEDDGEGDDGGLWGLLWDVAGKLWTSVNTALGMAYGAIGMAASWVAGIDMDISLGNNAVQFQNNPLNPPRISGMTLGNTIHYSPGTVPNNDCPLREHGKEHTYQYQKLGPSLFQPTSG